MRTLTIIELNTGGFILTSGETDLIQLTTRDTQVSVCPKLGHNYEYPNSRETLPGAVWAFFKPESPTTE